MTFSLQKESIAGENCGRETERKIRFFKFTPPDISHIYVHFVLIHLHNKIFCNVSPQEKDKPNSTTMNGSPGSAGIGDQMGVKIEPAEAESLSMSGSSGILSPVSPYACVKPISPEQEELINRLVSFQCEFEQPSEEDLKRITVSIVSCSFDILAKDLLSSSLFEI